MRTKKGNQLMTYGVGGVLALFIIGIIVFLLANVGGQFTSMSAVNSTERSIASNLTTGAQTFAGLSSVMWIILAVGVILLVLFSAVGWLLYKKGML